MSLESQTHRAHNCHFEPQLVELRWSRYPQTSWNQNSLRVIFLSFARAQLSRMQSAPGCCNTLKILAVLLLLAKFPCLISSYLVSREASCESQHRQRAREKQDKLVWPNKCRHWWRIKIELEIALLSTSLFDFTPFRLERIFASKSFSRQKVASKVSSSFGCARATRLLSFLSPPTRALRQFHTCRPKSEHNASKWS